MKKIIYIFIFFILTIGFWGMNDVFATTLEYDKECEKAKEALSNNEYRIIVKNGDTTYHYETYEFERGGDATQKATRRKTIDLTNFEIPVYDVVEVFCYEKRRNANGDFDTSDGDGDSGDGCQFGLLTNMTDVIWTEAKSEYKDNGAWSVASLSGYGTLVFQKKGDYVIDLKLNGDVEDINITLKFNVGKSSTEIEGEKIAETLGNSYKNSENDKLSVIIANEKNENKIVLKDELAGITLTNYNVVFNPKEEIEVNSGEKIKIFFYYTNSNLSSTGQKFSIERRQIRR